MKKADLRQIFRAKRAQINEETRAYNDQCILNHFIGLNFPSIRYLHRYLPVISQHEISNEDAVKYVEELNPSLIQVVPYMSGDIMLSSVYPKNSLLKKNKWGIDEPVSKISIDNKLIDCVIVPLLAFDLSGNRVGYGKGCYDRFLASCRPDVLKVGLSYFAPVQCITDTDEFDIPLNLCITPEKLYEFG
jgi:5-formyltetrahydrofolate cyclo-ligase